MKVKHSRSSNLNFVIFSILAIVAVVAFIVLVGLQKNSPQSIIFPEEPSTIGTKDLSGMGALITASPKQPQQPPVAMCQGLLGLSEWYQYSPNELVLISPSSVGRSFDVECWRQTPNDALKCRFEGTVGVIDKAIQGKFESVSREAESHCSKFQYKSNDGTSKKCVAYLGKGQDIVFTGVYFDKLTKTYVPYQRELVLSKSIRTRTDYFIPDNMKIDLHTYIYRTSGTPPQWYGATIGPLQSLKLNLLPIPCVQG